MKGLINKCFNIESYITTIRGTNMNLGIPQYKNCWKWGHLTFLCRIQEAKYIKYNGSYKSDTIANFCGVAKQMRKQTPQDSKLRRVNYTLIHPNVLTIEVSIKPTQTLVPSGSITSTMIGTTKNNKNFMKVEVIQIAQL